MSTATYKCCKRGKWEQGLSHSISQQSLSQHMWETAFSLWQGDSEVRLTAVVDNRVFPCDWQRPVIKGVSVRHQTVAINTTQGVHPQLAKSDQVGHFLKGEGKVNFLL